MSRLWFFKVSWQLCKGEMLKIGFIILFCKSKTYLSLKIHNTKNVSVSYGYVTNNKRCTVMIITNFDRVNKNSLKQIGWVIIIAKYQGLLTHPGIMF